MMDDWESGSLAVEETLLAVGAIDRCERCDTITDSLGGREEAIDELEHTYGREQAEALVDRYLSETPDQCDCYLKC